MDFVVRIEGRSLRVRLTESRIEVDGIPVDIDLVPAGTGPVRGIRVEGRTHRVIPRRNGSGTWSLEANGVRRTAEVLDPGIAAIRDSRAAQGGGGGTMPLRAPMPGLVVRLEVAVGDVVDVGSGLLIVEAMKMENELRAASAGRVATIHVVEGDVVEKDQVLIEFESPEGKK
jgi:biotin carboxyl carrier protein